MGMQLEPDQLDSSLGYLNWSWRRVFSSWMKLWKALVLITVERVYGLRNWSHNGEKRKEWIWWISVAYLFQVPNDLYPYLCLVTWGKKNYLPCLRCNKLDFCHLPPKESWILKWIAGSSEGIKCPPKRKFHIGCSERGIWLRIKYLDWDSIVSPINIKPVRTALHCLEK